jgi:hypothetical protein
VDYLWLICCEYTPFATPTFTNDVLDVAVWKPCFFLKLSVVNAAITNRKINYKCMDLVGVIFL